MLFKLLLLFIVVPLVELTLLLILAHLTHWTLTLLVVIVTGVAGTWLARSQGFQAYRRIQQELADGRMPTDPLLDAVMIFLAGALLLTPGLLTDVLGLSLLIPPCRKLYRTWLVRWLKSRFAMRSFTFTQSETGTDRSKIIDSYVVDRHRDDADKSSESEQQ